MIERKQRSEARILVSDSDDIKQAVGTAQRNGQRCEMVAADDAVTAMHKLLAGAFDLVIVDLAMPRIDGLRLISLIRATPKLRYLPILVIAPTREPGAPLEGVDAGADDYLPRPLEWPLMAMRIRQLTAERA